LGLMLEVNTIILKHLISQNLRMDASVIVAAHDLVGRPNLEVREAIGDKFPKPRGATPCRSLLKQQVAVRLAKLPARRHALDKWQVSFYGGHRWSNAKARSWSTRPVDSTDEHGVSLDNMLLRLTPVSIGYSRCSNIVGGDVSF
jgi:hypothetical protein